MSTDTDRTENSTATETKTETKTETDEERRPQTAWIGGLFWLLVGAYFAAQNWETIQPWAIKNWLLLLLIIGIVVVGGIMIGVRLAWRSATGQIGSVIFLGIPLILVLAATVWTISPDHRVSVLRSVFLVVVIFLPALLYFLFVALRKISLLQEFFTNLAKLGLLERRRQDDAEESERDRKIRIVTYLQKFEALYGTIPPPLVAEILEMTNPDRGDDKGDIPNFNLYQSSLFTPEAIPVVVATLLIGLGWLLVLPPWPVDENPRLVLTPAAEAALFAFLGAYFYSLQMLYRRFVRRDLRANAYVSISQRIILAVIGVWAVLQVFAGIPGVFVSDKAQASLLVIGFVVGAFPPIAWQVLQAAFRRLSRAEVFVPSLNSPMPLRELDGLTVWHEGRLEEEDIENVQNMSTASLVELMLYTRYPPDRIVDWVDQALLYTQLGGQTAQSKDGDRNAIKQLQDRGIRTASSLIVAYEKCKERGNDEAAKFESILGGDHKGLPRIPNIVDALSTNPNLELVQRWNGTRKPAKKTPEVRLAVVERPVSVAASQSSD